MKMKRGLFAIGIICVLFQFLSCSSAPPKIENVLSRHENGNTLFLVYSSYSAAIVLTDPDDIEKVRNRDFSNFSTINSLFFLDGHLDPIIVRESDSGLSVAVFSLPKNIETVMVLGFKTIIRKTGNDINASYIWTNPPEFVAINHNGNNNQGYIVRWNGRTTVDINQLSNNEALNYYSRAETYGSPREGKKVQPGFIPRR